MRLALVAPFGLRARGTTAGRVLPLAAELARRGHAVAVFVPPYDSPQDSGRIERRELGRGRLEVVHVRLPRGRAGMVWHARLSLRLLVALRRWRPDVVHAFKPKGPSGLAAAALWAQWSVARTARRLVCRSPDRRVLVMDADDWEGPGGWNDDPRAGYSGLQRAVFAWQERHGFRHADAWTVASRCLQDRAVALGAPPHRVFLLPNGVPDTMGSGSGAAVHGAPPEARQGEASAAAAHRAGRVLLYTRFTGVRPADVAAIWRLVIARCPAAQLAVAGRGPAGEEELLAALPGVTAVGWVERSNVPALLAGSQAAIVPWADTPINRGRSSVKLRELMAAGLAIVAAGVGELPETLGEAGILVPPGDVQAFATAVVNLLQNPERAAALGRAAQARAAGHLSWGLLADAALLAYAAPRR